MPKSTIDKAIARLIAVDLFRSLVAKSEVYTTGDVMASWGAYDTRPLRNVLSTFTTGVTVVTTRDKHGKLHGVTANSFSSVSPNPPLIFWS